MNGMNTNFEEKNRTTLCSRCTSDFYNTQAFDIRRDHGSNEMGQCCYCNSRQGFDYFVSKKKEPIRLKEV